MDKNHPPNGGIQAACKIVDDSVPHSLEYTKLYLLPEVKNENVPNYPFSYQFFAQCLSNGMHREDHLTLDNSDLPKTYGI